ncbi:Aromatic amino acid lyase [Klebsormidium nitens]|uniref:Aromatic amino acid lyase n=1 Tax=Klebsormidium nitens TaxID=105231 RepID=A0A1Y1I0C4_KLENI|nr:Aromatic amino acid lyase [Klebsormidium nitens]|eukprot:GAQ82226.1 Aromatic amino acid lyase [Klebsormidium nitens]
MLTKGKGKHPGDGFSIQDGNHQIVPSLTRPSAPKMDIKGDHLSIQDIIDVSLLGRHVPLSHDVDDHVAAAHQLILDRLKAGQPMYGVNTNFGGLATKQLTANEASALQENLIWGLKSGAGRKLPPYLVRAAMLIRANALARGASGARRILIERLLAFLNEGVTPVVHELGSIGASGDLIPLAEIVGCVIGLSKAYRVVDQNGRELDALAALAEMGLEPLRLERKEGLALVNGTSMMNGIACHVITDARKLLRLSLYLHAFYIQALEGSPEPFSAFLHQCKPHPGQVEAARLMRELLKGGKVLPNAEQMLESDKALIQDRYSIRCLPQYMGPILDAFALIEKQVEMEANCVDDNPLVDVSAGMVLNGGNFLGQYIGTGMDLLRYHVALLTKHLDTQIAMLVTPSMNNGLPASLVGTRADDTGIKLGLKALQIFANSVLPRLMHLASPITHLFPTHAEEYNQNINSQGSTLPTWQESLLVF